MIDPNHAREELEHILSDREYTIYYEDHRGLIEKTIDRIINWIVEQISKLFPNIEEVANGNGYLIFGLVVTGVVLLLIALFFLIRTIQRKRRFRDNKPLHSLSEKEWTYEMYMKEAENLENEGDYTKATRHLFLAILLYFDRREWLLAKPWKTNWEYYDELRSSSKERAERFFEFALLFDRATYGDHRVNLNEYERFKQEAISILKQEETVVRQEMEG
ncbi:DUF4129 domain-containing protein [Alkalihalobacillus sp. 1P02AB]|uniref:DUF4129 domain-containing protein n=1 Tax=Alkalihalobacillus sp. 1P02AB TaxID=3132260 RepID=UPI0039A6A557